VIGNAVRVMRIATGEEADDVIDDGKDLAAKALGAKGGKKRAENMTPEGRSEIAKKAAAKRWSGLEAGYAADEIVLPVEPTGLGAGRAIERLVVCLPPKERACVLLKDVFDHSLDEIADLVGSTSGGVKSALNRGRAKLAALPVQPVAAPAHDPDLARLLGRYVELFNARDSDGVRALTSADARLRVSDCYNGLLSGSPYFVEYERGEPWRMRPGAIEGEAVLVIDRLQGEAWRPAYFVRIHADGGVIDRIADYYACPWILEMVFADR